MDFEKVIIELLGIQEVDIEEINIHKKSRNVRVIVRQKRSECYCSKCGLQFDKIKDWIKREIKAPPMGVYNDVKIILFQICEESVKALIEAR